MLSDLSPLELKLLMRCASGEDIRSSYRPEDRAKQRLRRLGLVKYAGTPRRWSVTLRGAAELKPKEASL